MNKKKLMQRLCVMLLFAVVLSQTLAFPVSAASKSKKKPSTVTVISVKSTSYNSATVRWKKAKYATSYRIYYKQFGAKKWIKLKDVNAKTTGYKHKSSKKYPLKSGKRYVYTVRAYNKYGKKWGNYNKKGKSAVIKSKKAILEPTAAPKPDIVEPTAIPTPAPTAAALPPVSLIPQPTETPASTVTPVPTSTPAPTATPVPTSTPAPTATPVPTSTPQPTATPTPLPRATKIEYSSDSYTISNLDSRFYVLPMIYPSEAFVTTIKYIEVTSSDESVLKPDPDDKAYMIAVGPGTTTLTARTTDGTNLTATYHVTVENYYNVTYDNNYGESGRLHIVYRPGDIIHTSEKKRNREGYIFDGWYTKPEGGELVTTFTVSENTTLYAHWIKKDLSESVPIVNVYLDGEEIYKCDIRGETVSSDVKVEDVKFELLDNEDIIGDTYIEYHEYSNSSWVSFRAQRAGKMQVVAKYNDKVLKKWNINVMTDWSDYVGYVNWRRSMEAKLWTDSMCDRDKLIAINQYLRKEGVYDNGSDAAVYAWKETPLKMDCITANAMMGAFAEDLGLPVKYVNQHLGKEFDHLVDAYSAWGGHVFAIVYLDGEWTNCDATPYYHPSSNE